MIFACVVRLRDPSLNASTRATGLLEDRAGGSNRPTQARPACVDDVGGSTCRVYLPCRDVVGEVDPLGRGGEVCWRCAARASADGASGREGPMSLQPQVVYVVPEDTARVARAAFP